MEASYLVRKRYLSYVREMVATGYDLGAEHLALPSPQEVEDKVWQQRTIVTDQLGGNVDRLFKKHVSHWKRAPRPGSTASKGKRIPPPWRQETPRSLKDILNSRPSRPRWK